jgi:hypothetical protein
LKIERKSVKFAEFYGICFFYYFFILTGRACNSFTALAHSVVDSNKSFSLGRLNVFLKENRNSTKTDAGASLNAFLFA